MSHSIELKYSESTSKFRAVVKDPAKTELSILAIYEHHECWRVLDECEKNGFETVGYIEPIQEPLPEQLAYWGVSRVEFNTRSLPDRLEITSTLIHHDGEVIKSDEHEHVYGDDDLVNAICEGNFLPKAEFLSWSKAEQHSAQRAWVNWV